MDKDYSKMTVVQLKAECTERGLPTVPSKKSELLSRIMQDVVSKAQNDEEEEEEEEEVEEEEEAQQNEEEMLQGDDTGVEPDESILEADAEMKTDKANGQKNGTESMEAEPAGDKKEVKNESEKKESESEKKDAEKKDTEKQDAGTKEVKKLAQSEISKLPKPPGMTTNIDRKRIGLPDGVPDVPSYHSIQESRISETRLRTVILYPLDVVDMANPSLQQVLSKAQHFMLKYVLDKDLVMKGFVEIHFDTRGHANEAAETLGNLKLSNDHTIRQLAANEAGTAYKTAVIEKIVPHLSHQIKKASDDYDTRIVYVHNLPEDADDAAVAKLFPEAKSIMTAIDDEGKNKGFAYLSFETEEATSTCVKSHKELKVEDKKICVFQIKDLKSAAGIDTKRPFHRRGGVNRAPTQNQRGGKPQQRGGPGYMSQGRGGRPPLPQARGGYNMRGGMDRGGMDRGGMRGGRGGRGGSVPSLMNMPRPGNYDQRGMGGGRAPRYMAGEEVPEFDVGYIQFQERKRRAVEAGFMEMGDGQPWKMSRGAGGGGYAGGRYSGGGSGGGGGGNWGGSRW